MPNCKKLFTLIYLTNSIDGRIYCFNLSIPIPYNKFYVLTKLIHTTFIRFQINNFTDSTSQVTFFFTFTLPEVGEIIKVIDTSFEYLKKILTRLKARALLRYKILEDYNKIMRIDKELEFIASLAASDLRYKTSSLFQVKSPHLRKKKIYQKKYEECEYSFVTALDLINYYFSYFEKRKRWSSSLRLQRLPKVECKKQDLDNCMEMETPFPIVIEEPMKLIDEGFSMDFWEDLLKNNDQKNQCTILENIP